MTATPATWPRADYLRPPAAGAPAARLEAIVGPMYSGKSAELIRRVHLAEIADLGVRVFRPHVDTRGRETTVESRNGMHAAATLVECATQILAHLDARVQVVGIDEAEFFDQGLEDVVRRLLASGRNVILAGLDLDFAAQPFGPIPRLLALADSVDKLTAVCMVCHSFFATRTQRLIDGEPARADSPLILVDQIDARVEYQARCAACYEPPA